MEIKTNLNLLYPGIVFFLVKIKRAEQQQS